MRLPLHYVVLAAVLAAVGVYFYGHHKGWMQRDQEMQLEIARKNDEARAKEQKLTEEIDDVNKTLAEANNALEKESSALQRAIRAGRVRLPAPSCVQASPSAPAPTGDRQEARSEPDGAPDPAADAERATLAAIAEIVAQGDRNTVQLNACIDAYNEVRNTLNGQR
jgi:hypothetical protein